MSNPGRLNKRIQISIPTQVSDGGGGYEEALTLWKKVWAKINPLSGREYWQVQQAQAQISHEVEIRYIEGLTRRHIIEFNGKSYDIQYIINVEESNRFLKIHVLERQ